MVLTRACGHSLLCDLGYNGTVHRFPEKGRLLGILLQQPGPSRKLSRGAQAFNKSQSGVVVSVALTHYTQT